MVNFDPALTFPALTVMVPGAFILLLTPCSVRLPSTVTG